MSGFIAGAAKFISDERVSCDFTLCFAVYGVIMGIMFMRMDWPRKKRLLAVLALCVIDAAYFGLSNPEGASSVTIIIGGVLMLATLYVLASLGVALVALFVPIKVATRKRLVLCVSLVTAFLILMQSIGQLGWRDVLAALPLFLVAYLYITYSGVTTESKTRDRDYKAR